MTTPNRKLILLVALVVLFVGAVISLHSPALGASALWSLSNGGRWLLPLIAVSAAIDSVNPCAFSILLLTVAFLFSIGLLRSDIIKIGSSYIAGVLIVYILIGLGILQTLNLFNTPHFMARVGATLLVLLGLITLINEFFPSFPIKLRILQSAHRPMAKLMEQSSLPTAFLLGGLVGLCEFPCTGGPYLAALGLLHDHATYWVGLGYLLLYNIIFIFPLVIILLIASDRALLERAQTWKSEKSREMRLYGGLAMIALGFVIFLL